MVKLLTLIIVGSCFLYAGRNRVYGAGGPDLAGLILVHEKRAESRFPEDFGSLIFSRANRRRGPAPANSNGASERGGPGICRAVNKPAYCAGGPAYLPDLA